MRIDQKHAEYGGVDNVGVECAVYRLGNKWLITTNTATVGFGACGCSMFVGLLVGGEQRTERKPITNSIQEQFCAIATNLLDLTYT
jgi:hypothetical protein